VIWVYGETSLAGGVTPMDGWMGGWPVYLGAIGSVCVRRRAFVGFCFLGALDTLSMAMGKGGGMALYAPAALPTRSVFSFFFNNKKFSARGIGG